MNKLVKIFVRMTLASSLLVSAVAQQEVNPDYYPPVPDVKLQQPHKSQSVVTSAPKQGGKASLIPVVYQRTTTHGTPQKAGANAVKRQHKNMSAK